LAKDRRNVYGEALHGARKSIPLRKKLRHYANRHQESKLPSEPAPFEAETADEIESSMHDKVPPVWDQYPETPLGDVITKSNGERLPSPTESAQSSSSHADFNTGCLLSTGAIVPA
jgi:hypothetical protein